MGRKPKSEKTEDKLFSKDELYRTYVELLFKKEKCIQDAEQYRIQYVCEFGELTADLFKAKIECIRLKKYITFCQKSINKGQKVDTEKMDKSIEKEMVVYETQLKEIIADFNKAKNAKTLTTYDSNIVKKIYRRLAKKLHPDINSLTEKEPELRDLWEKILDAYYRADLDRLEELEVLAEALLEKYGLEEAGRDIEDIEDRIKALEIKIGMIINEKPYSYIEILRDDELIEKKKEEMKKEIKEFKKYASELEEVLADLIMQGGGSVTWRTKLQ